ncbi:hypothetical protein EBU99_11045 [bacterium]|nr:hypothetical protein [bacterium]
MSTAVYKEDEQAITQSGIWLVRACLVYLSLPILIFVSYWLNTGAALLFATLLIYGSYVSWSSEEPPGSAYEVFANLMTTHAIPFCLFFVWCALSGTGGIGFQNTDYAASNALLKDLIENPWPLQMKGNIPLVYYVSYYLPAALIGKLTNWTIANLFIFIWTFVGLSLVWSVLCLALKLTTLSRAKLTFAAFIFILFGGWDILGAALTYSSEILTPGTHIEWWASIGQFSSNTTLLFWVPQHVIAPWLMTSLLLLLLHRGIGHKSVLFLAACAFLWSPIACLGLLPFIAALFVRDIFTDKGANFLSSANFFVPPFVALLGFLFYSSNAFNFPNEWQFSHPNFWRNYSLLFLFEILPIAVPFLVQHRKAKIFLNEINLPPPLNLSRMEKLFGWIALLSLVILPFYKMGIMNDLCMRASIPGLFILMSFWLRVFRKEFTFEYIPLAAVFICTILGAGSAVSEIYRSFANYDVKIPDARSVGSLLTNPENSVIEQRAGNPNAFFWHWLGPINQKNLVTPKP